MISHLKGIMISRTTEEVIIESNGVGYGVIVPLGTYYELPEVGGEVALYIYTQIRDDNIRLYGFFSSEEKKIFELLIGSPDIGPRMAQR